MAKILIADDEIALLGLMRMALEDEGHEVLVAETGGEVLPALRERRPDVLILDVMLPGLDGLSLQKEIAKDPALAKVPVIVVTAQGAFLRLFKEFEQVTARLKKPFRNETLLSAVREALARKGTSA